MRALIDRYIDAYNRLDVDGMLATLHPQVTFENVTAGVTTVRTQGIEEFRRLAQSTLPLFARRRQTVVSYVESNGVAQVGIAPGALGVHVGAQVAVVAEGQVVHAPAVVAQQEAGLVEPLLA